MTTVSTPLHRIRPFLGWMVRTPFAPRGDAPHVPPPRVHEPVEIDIDLDQLERLEEAEWHTRPAAYRRLA